MSKLSASNCRPILHGEAPNANRVAISRSRADPRARNSPDTFKQARPKSTAVTANSTQSGCFNRRLSVECPCGAAVSSSVELRNACRRSGVTTGKLGEMRVLFQHRLEPRLQPRLRLLQRHTLIQASQDLHPTCPPVEQIVETRDGLRRHRCGNPDRRNFANIDAFKSRCGYADDQSTDGC